jgi:phage replication-related protein YjqB (UPF0714/DUF867 family)
MADTYKNFAELLVAEGAKAYRVVSLPRGSEVAVIAPHGGGIEPGTSELARAIAGTELTLYLFEGRKKQGNKALHITSHAFDEPQGVAAVAVAAVVLAVHGEGNKDEAVAYVGGRDEALGTTIEQHLEAAGFTVQKHTNPDLQGVSRNNICNRGQSGAGVQLEVSEALRAQFFPSLDAEGRAAPRKKFYDFVRAVRRGLGLPGPD